MAELRIEMTKRADGSATWQHHRGRQAAFFPAHDLTHYAVETELGVSCGFYGLVAAGWDIEDTTGQGARGPIPESAVAIERLVGLLDLERAGSARWSAAELDRQLAADRSVSEDELTRVRSRLRELFTRWTALEPGSTLELPFDRPVQEPPRRAPAARPIAR